MNTNESRKGLSKIIILIILTAIIGIIGYAYARYISTLKGKVNAQIATWSFKVDVNKNEFKDDTKINLASTRIKENGIHMKLVQLTWSNYKD